MKTGSFFGNHRHWFTAVAALCLAVALLIPVLGCAESENVPMTDFTLVDQYGNTHTLADYQGKAVFLNFWATWCPPCRAEMPDFEELYHELGENQGDFIILGIAAPGSAHDPEYDAEGIAGFLKEMGISYPVLIDADAALFDEFITVGYPTSLFIAPDGTIYNVDIGMLDKGYVKSHLAEILK